MEENGFWNVQSVKSARSLQTLEEEESEGEHSEGHTVAHRLKGSLALRSACHGCATEGEAGDAQK